MCVVFVRVCFVLGKGAVCACVCVCLRALKILGPFFAVDGEETLIVWLQRLIGLEAGM